jgi:hypothetical protein
LRNESTGVLHLQQLLTIDLQDVCRRHRISVGIKSTIKAKPNLENSSIRSAGNIEDVYALLGTRPWVPCKRNNHLSNSKLEQTTVTKKAWLRRLRNNGMDTTDDCTPTNSNGLSADNVRQVLQKRANLGECRAWMVYRLHVIINVVRHRLMNIRVISWQ